MGARLHLGTSGFAYSSWRGSFYPERIRARDMLAFYAGRFDSVEINYSFRRLPEEATLVSWHDTVGEGFTFTLKAHQLITHWLRLRGTDPAVATFLDRARLLGSRLGVVLFQTPPNLSFDPALLRGFLRLLPADLRYAFEFRHPSWDAARATLRAHGVVWCMADTDEQPSGDAALPEGPFAYLRLRKTAYAPDELAAWAERIGAALGGGADVFCYFKHEEAGAGPRFAERLRRLIPANDG